MQYSLALRGKKPSVFDLLLNGRLHGILVDLRGVTDSRVITTDLLAADERAEIESLRPECKPFKYEQVTPTQLAAWPKD